ncbi:MAG: hypothetical protein ACK56F_24255 [bacterium]
MKVASDVLLLLCLHDFGLRVSIELGQATAFLYSEVRLYKGARPAFPPSVDGHTFYRQHLRVDRESTTATHVEQI